ncbi:hypothetical protein CDD83_5403 [Cordyceps sp. RAO-2017]|nr:hypothetical protein CDD83_5403 [Cordyceps sp. RAO-2017]
MRKRGSSSSRGCKHVKIPSPEVGSSALTSNRSTTFGTGGTVGPGALGYGPGRLSMKSPDCVMFFPDSEVRDNRLRLYNVSMETAESYGAPRRFRVRKGNVVETWLLNFRARARRPAVRRTLNLSREPWGLRTPASGHWDNFNARWFINMT